MPRIARLKLKPENREVQENIALGSIFGSTGPPHMTNLDPLT